MSKMIYLEGYYINVDNIEFMYRHESPESTYTVLHMRSGYLLRSEMPVEEIAYLIKKGGSDER